MKSIYKSLSVIGLVSAMTLTGCYDMDKLSMSDALTRQQKIDAAEANPALTRAGIAGIAAMFSTFGQVLGQDVHSDFGVPALMLGLDCRGVDMVSRNIGYNWFRTFMTFGDCNVNSDMTNMAWNYYYRQILACNDAIGSINADSEDATIQFYLAQALAMRANAYFNLAQIYQFTYKGNEDKPCVMLITENNQDEVLANGCTRSSVAEIYAQIDSDINRAVDLLTRSGLSPDKVIEAKPKRFISLAAAHGLRARINLVKQDWTAAAADATEAIQLFAATGGSPLSLEQAARPGFNSIEAANWMWGIAIAETDPVATTQIVNFPSHMGSLCYGYASVGAWRYVNRKLFDNIPDSDVRKGWFFDEQGYSPNLTEREQAYCSSKSMPPYVQVKFAPYQDVLGTTNNASDIPLMRVEEMYLIRAEATAMAGGDGASILTDFVSRYRNPAFSFSGSGEDVREACFQQRRVELFGEGLINFDYMRLNKDYDRVGGGFEPNYCFNIQAGSPVLIMPIPNSEINGNKLFLSSANNSPAPMPSPVQDVEYSVPLD